MTFSNSEPTVPSVACHGSGPGLAEPLTCYLAWQDPRQGPIDSPAFSLPILAALGHCRATPDRKRERFRFPGRIDPAIRAVISYELSIKAREREFLEDSQNMRYPVILVMSCDHYL